MSMPGWYPDPGGAQGRFRWWDGGTWSAETTPDPRSGPPGAAAAGGPPGQPGTGQPGAARTGAPASSRRGTAWPWVVGLVAFVVVLALVGWFVLRPLIVQAGGGGTDPGGTSTRETCPPQSGESAALPPQGSDGRVRGGPLSYPKLGTPWSEPVPEGRIPFGRDVVDQQIPTEPTWYAGLFVGRLMAGDGFFTPEEGSKIVVRCIQGTFYGTSPVGREDRRNEAVTVDGHDAWMVETHFTFDVADVAAKGEWVMIVIVDVGDGSAGLFFASVPDNASQYVEPARQAYEKLTVTT